MDTGYAHLALMFALGIPCGIVAVTAGGGVTLGVPLLMLVGAPAAESVVAVKVALWASFLTGSIAHARRRPEFAVPTQWWMWPLCVIGAVAGSQLLTALKPERMREVVLAMLVASTIGTIWATRQKKDPHVAPTSLHRFAGFVAVVALAVYSGFFGAGFGVLLIWALVALHGHTSGSAAALGTRLSLIISSASIAVFIWRGAVPWSTVIPLGFGCAAGGVLGARATNALGDKFIRTTTWVVSILVAVKLIVSP